MLFKCLDTRVYNVVQTRKYAWFMTNQKEALKNWRHISMGVLQVLACKQIIGLGTYPAYYEWERKIIGGKNSELSFNDDKLIIPTCFAALLIAWASK